MPGQDNAFLGVLNAALINQAQTGAEMPRYKCHKEVHALKIKAIQRREEPNHDPTCESDGCSAGAIITPEDAGYAPFVVSAEYMRKHRPQVGGYYVVYEDGYKSFSPAKAFEDGYARIK